MVAARSSFFLRVSVIFLLAFSLTFIATETAYSQSQPGIDPKCRIKNSKGQYINEGKTCVVDKSPGKCAKGKCTITEAGEGKGDGKMPEMPKFPEMPKGGEKGGGESPPQQPPITTDRDPCVGGVNSAFGEISRKADGSPCVSTPRQTPASTSPATTTPTTTRQTFRMFITNFQTIFSPTPQSATTTNNFWDRNRQFVENQYNLDANTNPNAQWQGGVKGYSGNAPTGGFVTPGGTFVGGFDSRNSFYSMLNGAGQAANNIWSGVRSLFGQIF